MSNHSDFSSHGYEVIRELGRNREAGRITYLAKRSPLAPLDKGGTRGGDLDRGGTGEEIVVIKEFRFAMGGADWSGFKAYQREIELLQQLNHPRIPRYLDSFETASGFCLVQEYKNAPSLAERRIYYPEQIKQIAVSVLEILAYLQKLTPPVIHRDIKPENILVDKQQNAYLVDFGFARIRGGDMALSSVAAGTIGFMPPEEQFGRPLTEASDLYSLGATLICLVTGTRSVDVGKLIDDNYRFEFKKLVPKINPRFVEWLTKMVEPNLKNRYADAVVALETLKQIQVIHSGNQNNANIRAGLAAGAILLLGIGGTQIYSYFKPHPSQPFVAPVQNLEQQQSYLSTPVPFRISSLNDSFAFVGTFEGEYRIFPDYIEVNLTKATIHLRDEKQSNLSSIYLGLGAVIPSGWNMLNRSNGVRVDRMMKPGDTYTLPPTRFFIQKERSIDLSKRWLVVELEEITEGEQNSSFTCYAHSDRNIFQRDADIDYIRQGDKLMFLKRYQEAVVAYEKAVEISPESTLAWISRGHALHGLVKYKEALSSYDKAIQLAPDNSYAWDGRCNTLNALGQYQEALTACDKAIKINPNFAWTWNIRGVALAGLNRNQEAIASYDKSLQIQQDDPTVIQNRSQVLKKLGRKP